MAEDDVLDLDIRRTIYTFINRNPGVHERELSRKLHIPLSTLDYHLYNLRKRGLISTRSDGHYTRYYVEDVGVKDKKIISVLRQRTARQIILFLLKNPNSYHRDIAAHLNLARSTTTFHLNKLVESNIVERVQKGRESTFTVVEPEDIIDLLITYQSSFIDTAVDKFIDTWLELHPDHIKKPKKRKDQRADTQDDRPLFSFILFWV